MCIRDRNVDAMLLQDLIGDNCDLETISGGCDCDTHQRLSLIHI